ncbi:MAG: zinc-finger domain-containing protein [Burkholderiaceae bacterium]|jgi:uncharacterized Zn-finger protein|nr:zinc-finger domain-containing protein [Burkholderiaceae bacterium]
MTSSAIQTTRAVELDAQDLTPGGEAWCPHPKSGIPAWSGHPRVFLDLSGGQARCPYCGTLYRPKTALPGQTG